MILLQKLQAYSQVYVNRKLLNLEKALGRQVVSVLFSTNKVGKQNEMKNVETHREQKDELIYWVERATRQLPIKAE